MLTRVDIPKCLVALQDQLISLFTDPKLFWGIFTGLGPLLASSPEVFNKKMP